MKSYNIAVIGGDGIGPEVTAEALKVLRAAGDKFEVLQFKPTDYPWGAEHYLEDRRAHAGRPPSTSSASTTPSSSARSAIRGSRRDSSSARSSAGCRFGLDLYINLRPIKLYAEHLCPLKDK